MAIQTRPESWPARAQSGTGMVEAILAIPVLLVLSTVALQLFLVACARVQLSHAAFYAARVAAVRGAGATDEMEAAVRRILGAGFVPVSPVGGGVVIDVLPQARGSGGTKAAGPRRDAMEMVGVRVRWDYPLLLPLAGRLLSPAHVDLSLSWPPTIRLTSVWSIPAHQVDPKEPEDV